MVQDLFNQLKNEYGSIWREFYNYSEKKMKQEANEFRNMIKEYNKTISNPMKKIILTNPYYYDKLVGCGHRYACEISGHRREDVEGTVALYCGWDTSVL